MSGHLQDKVLQVLREGRFTRPGGKSDVRVDTRVIAASSQDLEGAASGGGFREDLLSRLSAACIAVPPLRDRREDIPQLVEHLVKKYSVHYNRRRPEIPGETLALLARYDWPGNVRELENVVRRIVILGAGAPLQRELSRAIADAATAPASPRPAPFSAPQGADSPLAPALPGAAALAVPAAPEPASYSLKEIARRASRRAERELISRMLQQTRWNRKETAELLGISYKALLYKIKENGLDKAPSGS
jgi:two-component system response regulator AtoC